MAQHRSPSTLHSCILGSSLLPPQWCLSARVASRAWRDFLNRQLARLETLKALLECIDELGLPDDFDDMAMAGEATAPCFCRPKPQFDEQVRALAESHFAWQPGSAFIPLGALSGQTLQAVVHCGGREELLCVQDAVEVKHLSQPANLFIWARKFCGDLPKDQRAALVLVLRLLLQSYFFTTGLVLHADGEDLLVSTIHAILWEHKVT